MSYQQQGYPQQQPQQGYYPGAYPPPVGPVPGANPASAIIAGILGLLVAASLVVVNIDFFGQLDGLTLSTLPSQFTVIVIIRFAAAAIALLGAVLVFARKVAGAIILAVGGLAGVAAVLLYPVVLGTLGRRFGDFGAYFDSLFKFDGAQATFSAIALIASPIALILALIPPTLRYLRASGVPAYPQQGYPQQQQGYPQSW
jgi:hypothetical protein